MSKMQTQIIQTEYGVYVPKAYSPVTERMVIATAPSLIARNSRIEEGPCSSRLQESRHRADSRCNTGEVAGKTDPREAHSQL